MAITKIKHKGLRELWVDGKTRRVGKEYHRNALAIMDYLHRIRRDIDDCAGFKGFHRLSGDRKGEYTMHVSGNWCITFTFDGKDVTVLHFGGLSLMVKIDRKRRPSTPGEILKVLFMEQRNISVSSLAEAIGLSRKHMSRIVNGRARLEPAIAARLGKALGTSAQIWVDLQAELDAWDAEKEARNWKPGRIFPAAA